MTQLIKSFWTSQAHSIPSMIRSILIWNISLVLCLSCDRRINLQRLLGILNVSNYELSLSSETPKKTLFSPFLVSHLVFSRLLRNSVGSQTGLMMHILVIFSSSTVDLFSTQREYFWGEWSQNYWISNPYEVRWTQRSNFTKSPDIFRGKRLHPY